MDRFYKEVNTGCELELTHKTGNKFTIKIHKFPKPGDLSLINPNWKLSKNEFVMSESKFEKALNSGLLIKN